MKDYIFLMHNDAPEVSDAGSDWESYIAKLRKNGNFEGGSAIGAGECVSKSGAASGITTHLSGYIRVQAESLDHAKKLVEGNRWRNRVDAHTVIRSFQDHAAGQCHPPGLGGSVMTLFLLRPPAQH